MSAPSSSSNSEPVEHVGLAALMVAAANPADVPASVMEAAAPALPAARRQLEAMPPEKRALLEATVRATKTVQVSASGVVRGQHMRIPLVVVAQAATRTAAARGSTRGTSSFKGLDMTTLRDLAAQLISDIQQVTEEAGREAGEADGDANGGVQHRSS